MQAYALFSAKLFRVCVCMHRQLKTRVVSRKQQTDIERNILQRELFKYLIILISFQDISAYHYYRTNVSSHIVAGSLLSLFLFIPPREGLHMKVLCIIFSYLT